MIIRKNCVFCGDILNNNLFKEDLTCHLGHYQVENLDNNFKEIPYNICLCNNCNTSQIKYLGDLSEVYRINHADNTGKIMSELHELNSNLILKYKNDIGNIIEIGSSVGTLSDKILKKLNVNYYIIEPSYLGNKENKIIISDYYENVKDSEIDADTLIISHVFEHFYEPKKILEKITSNLKIKNFFLVFPDLEHYVNNDILHVLNTEHTYYVDNDFLIKMLSLYGFEVVEQQKFEGHSILFYFKRTKLITNFENLKINFKNKNYNIVKFFENIKLKIERYNEIIDKNDNVYLWPASVHSIYLCIFGLNYKKLKGLLDNSTLKIGKKMYGINLPILSFDKISENDENKILINGGVFNKEVLKKLNKNYII